MIYVYVPAKPMCEFITGVSKNVFTAYKGFKIINSNPEKADIIIASHFGDGKGYYPNAIKIFLDGEASSEYSGIRGKPLSAAFDSQIYIGPTANHETLKKKNIKCIYIPFVSLSFGQRKLHTPLDLINKNCSQIPELFCAYLAYNPIKYREKLFDTLYNYFKPKNLIVDALGKCNGSIKQKYKSKNRFKKDWIDNAVELFRPYKFSLALENEIINGYITEKIANSYLSNSIPIFSGHQDIFNIFNPNSFIYLDTTKDMSESFNKIFEISIDKIKFKNFISQDVISNDKLSKYFSWHKSINGTLADEICELSIKVLRNYRNI